MLFRTKPVEIEAYEFSKNYEVEAPAWFTKAVNDEKVFIDRCINDGAVRVYGCTIYHGKRSESIRNGGFVVREKNGKLRLIERKVFCSLFEPLERR